jgi:hypothetical protein
MIGIALRHGQAAGLHLKFEGPTTSPVRKKALGRLWWALYSIESILTAITGRPRTVDIRDCTAPPPGSSVATMRPHSQEDNRVHLSGSTSPTASSSGTPGNATVDSFEIAYVGLDILMDKILSGLYLLEASREQDLVVIRGAGCVGSTIIKPEAVFCRELVLFSPKPGAACALLLLLQCKNLHHTTLFVQNRSTDQGTERRICTVLSEECRGLYRSSIRYLLLVAGFSSFPMALREGSMVVCCTYE